MKASCKNLGNQLMYDFAGLM